MAAGVLTESNHFTIEQQKAHIASASPKLIPAKKSVTSLDNETAGAGLDQITTPTDPHVPTKLQYVSPTNEAYALLEQEMKKRLTEGRGEAFYELGVGDTSSSGLTDDEMSASLATLKSLATVFDACCVELKKKSADKGSIVECLVRQRAAEDDFMEVRVAVVGNVDAGKSTLLGVLTHGELDNGRGYARQKLFRHKHEMESGRTSSVGNDILGFDSEGRVVNKPEGHGTLDWIKVCKASSKVVTFIDLAGHEKYLKTTIFGMTGHAPDFCMLMVGSNAGIVGMAKEHLGLALALSVPVFVVVTKIDMCPPNVLQENIKLLLRILKSAGCRKIPVMVSTQDDVITSATNFSSERICPIFQVSSVTGENLDLLKSFLNLLTTRVPANDDKPAEFQIDETYSVPGVGTVISGTCMQGIIKLNDTLLLGPTGAGDFIPVTIRSVQRKRLPVNEVRGGQTASFALKKIKRNQIRKGMVLIARELQPTACWEFIGDILVLHHPTTISPKYQAMVHCGSARQTASIVEMNCEHLRTGDKATCRFRFIKNPEFIHPGARMVFREGRTKAVGNVTTVFPYIPGTSSSAYKLKTSKITKASMHGTGERRGGKKKRGKNRTKSTAATATTSSNTSTTTASDTKPDTPEVKLTSSDN